jgi:hypothetical protein
MLIMSKASGDNERRIKNFSKKGTLKLILRRSLLLKLPTDTIPAALNK